MPPMTEPAFRCEVGNRGETYVYLDDEGIVAQTIEVEAGHVYVDVDGDGHPVGVEVL